METEIHFVIEGKPLVQKNNLNIRYRQTKGKRVPFIAHTKEMSDVRNAMAMEFYKQYKKQKFFKPIDYLFEIDLVFYVRKQHEPDLDNLPAIVLDALQGVRLKGGKNNIAVTLLDDKLLRQERSRKIVEGDEDYNGKPRTEVTIRRYQVPIPVGAAGPALEGSD